MTRVLVAVDDTEGSVRAAETAHRLFGDEAEYLAVNVANVADQSGLPDATAVGEEGDPASAILRAAEERGVDVIVVGTEERGWLDRFLRPSVSKEIVRQAHVPVLIV